MRICRECYTSVYGDEIKECPFCGISLDKEGENENYEYIIPKTHNFKTILIFTLIASTLILSIFSVDKLVKSGIGFSTSDCGYNEECFLTALAICDTKSAVKPKSYGLTYAEILGENDDGCLVRVDAVVYDNERERDIEKGKICAFPKETINQNGIDDLFFCKDFEGADLKDVAEISDDEWARRAVKQIKDETITPEFENQ